MFVSLVVFEAKEMDGVAPEGGYRWGTSVRARLTSGKHQSLWGGHKEKPGSCWGSLDRQEQDSVGWWIPRTNGLLKGNWSPQCHVLLQSMSEKS